MTTHFVAIVLDNESLENGRMMKMPLMTLSNFLNFEFLCKVNSFFSDKPHNDLNEYKLYNLMTLKRSKMNFLGQIDEKMWGCMP